jgi:hypothetical protein
MDSPAQVNPVRRAQLLARLAAERSHLLLQLEGLDEETLSHNPVVEGWTAAGLLAHLGYWDAFAADRLMKLADGRLNEIRPVEKHDTLEAHNQEARVRFAGLPFTQGLAIALKERRGLHLALQSVPDDVLEAPVQLRPGWQTTPRVWARWPARHDAEHAADLVRWRAGYPPNDPSLRVTHRELLRPILGLSRNEFRALAALIPASERETRPVEGVWTLKQVLGHLIDYEGLGIIALTSIAAGREPEYQNTIHDFDAFNNMRGVVWQARPWAEVSTRYLSMRHTLLQTAARLKGEALARPFAAPWPATTTACGYLLDMAQHEREHADGLRRSLGLPALPRRLGRAN